ncbi:hypothetical protein EDB85DRAFT_1900648 [Lactarius pseudohatsudake]|nr:hypothetical protein EDB85DRAFT_1900648 [Lactarius pseudohatsudake]
MKVYDMGQNESYVPPGRGGNTSTPTETTRRHAKVAREGCRGEGMRKDGKRLEGLKIHFRDCLSQTWISRRPERLIFFHPLPTAPFTSDLGVPPGYLGGERPLPPPSFFPGVFKPSKLFPSFLILSPRHPSRATLACRLVASVGVLVFPPLPGGTPSYSVLNIPFQVGGPWIVTPGLPLRRRPLTTLGHPPPTAVAESQWGEPRSRAFGTGARVAGSISSGLVLLPLVSVGEEEGGAGQEWQACPSSSPGRGAMLDTYTLSVVVESSSPGWRSLERCSIPLPPPSPSDDLRPPLSYRCRGVAEGCRSEKRKAGQDRSGKPVLRRVLAVERCSIHTHSLSSSSPRLRVGGPWSAAPYLFLRRRPLTTLGRPSPTAVAESQRGEPRSRAFGTGARVAGSISSGPVLLPLVGNRVGSGKRKAAQGGSGIPPPFAGVKWVVRGV